MVSDISARHRQCLPDCFVISMTYAGACRAVRGSSPCIAKSDTPAGRQCPYLLAATGRENPFLARPSSGFYICCGEHRRDLTVPTRKPAQSDTKTGHPQAHLTRPLQVGTLAQMRHMHTHTKQHDTTQTQGTPQVPRRPAIRCVCGAERKETFYYCSLVQATGTTIS